VLATVTLGSGPRRSVKSWKPPSVAPLGPLNAPTSRNMVFVMPGDLTLDELPTPNDARVHLHGVSPRRVAVLRFRGRHGGDLPAQKRNELLFLLKCAGLKAASEVWFAGYDGPTTLGFLRRNEVLVELAD
jgi:SOUL heme-binding protein